MADKKPPRSGPPAPGRTEPGPFPKDNHPPQGAPPPFKPTPTAGKTTTTGAAFNAFINAHPNMRSYADSIWKWAGEYGIDKVVAASLFWRESFAEAARLGVSPETILSKKGAVGIGQIMPLHVGEKAPWGTLTQSDLTNPDKNIRWSMWYFKQKVRDWGSYDEAYKHNPGGYNPGYTGSPFSSLFPKGYVPRSGLSPREKAEESAAQSNIRAGLTDPWVMGVKHGGKLALSSSDTIPKKGLKLDGLNMRLSDFLRLKRQLEETFVSYTGKRPSNAQVQQFIENGWSPFALTDVLSKTKAFASSPIYKRDSASLMEAGKDVGGASKEDIRQAVVYGWSPTDLQAELRKRPTYLTSNEFKSKVSQMGNVYENIYGTMNDKAVKQVQEAALGGWSPIQYESWLRAQPNYTRSSEYQAKALSFFDALGLLTGQQAVLKPGKLPANSNINTSGALPNSPRIPGAPVAPGAMNNLTPGLL